MLLYAINAFGCLSHTLLLNGQTCDDLAIREMAAVLASIRVQENLPKIAKLYNSMINSSSALNSSALSAFQVWLNSDNSLFSSVLESAVSNRQVLLIGHACLAFSALVCVVSVSAEAATFLFIWFFEAIFLCVKGGIR